MVQSNDSRIGIGSGDGLSRHETWLTLSLSSPLALQLSVSSALGSPVVIYHLFLAKHCSLLEYRHQYPNRIVT
jgi:hypothetical protein